MGHVLLFFVKCYLFFNSYLKPGIKCDFTEPTTNKSLNTGKQKKCKKNGNITYED
jgi:hypothetical protein